MFVNDPRASNRVPQMRRVVRGCIFCRRPAGGISFAQTPPGGGRS
ncbi:hypothetical protein BCEN4_760001 [Burkholderia cenocepacia]|nr:hypothetical protein BCEN4_760001 [Burkholderia cenocepacia]